MVNKRQEKHQTERDVVLTSIACLVSTEESLWEEQIARRNGRNKSWNQLSSFGSGSIPGKAGLQTLSVFGLFLRIKYHDSGQALGKQINSSWNLKGNLLWREESVGIWVRVLSHVYC